MSALPSPKTNPTPIFEIFRGSYATELLTVAVMQFKLFEMLRKGPLSFATIRQNCGLSERAMRVLQTAIQSMGLIRCHKFTGHDSDQYELTDLAREHILAGEEFDVSAYVGLAADAPGVAAMASRLRSDKPAEKHVGGTGAAFIYRDGMDSAMEEEKSARHLTMALAGRAKNVAPVLAQVAPIQNTKKILDIGGGTGIYSFAMLRKYPHLKAVIMDRAQVLKVAKEMATEYNVSDRVEFLPGDFFADAFPSDCDTLLLSNILHDWHTPECREIVQKCAKALPVGGQLLIHDVFLNDDLSGPLPTALYSAALFTLTEGRAYSGLEYQTWLREAGLKVQPMQPTLVHCGVMAAVK